MPRIVPCFILLTALGCVPSAPAVKPQRHDFRLAECAEAYQAGDLEGATTKLLAYTAEYPRDALGWTLLGNCHEEADRDQEALQAYDAAIAIDPRQHQAHTGKGIVYRKLEDYDSAMASYERAVEIEPKYAEAYSSMAMILIKRKQDQQAVDYALKAYRLESDNPVIAANLAVAYHYNGEPEKREEFTRIAESLGYKSIAKIRRIFSGELSVRD